MEGFDGYNGRKTRCLASSSPGTARRLISFVDSLRMFLFLGVLATGSTSALAQIPLNSASAHHEILVTNAVVIDGHARQHTQRGDIYKEWQDRGCRREPADACHG